MEVGVGRLVQVITKTCLGTISLRIENNAFCISFCILGSISRDVIKEKTEVLMSKVIKPVHISIICTIPIDITASTPTATVSPWPYPEE